MKITNQQLRQIIREELAREAKAAIPVRTVSPEDYDPPAHLGAEGPRTSEVPQARVGNFFMRDASVGMPTRGYSSLKKQKILYMILPDRTAIRVGDFPGDPSREITTAKAGENWRTVDDRVKNYLSHLNDGVTVLPVSDFNNPTPADLENMRAMADDIERVAQGFQLNASHRTQYDKKNKLDEVQLSHAGIRLKRGNTLPSDPSLERDPAKVKRRSLLSLGSSLATASRVVGDLKRLGLDLPEGIEAVFVYVEEADRLFDALNIRF